MHPIKTNRTIHQQFADTTQKWSGMDNPDRWRKHQDIPEKRQLLSDIGWTEDSVTYRFNKQGFRSDKFHGDGVMFLGCSMTLGTGVDWERTWAYQVAASLGLRCWNLGIGGGSHDTCFRNAQEWIPQLNPKRVFVLGPSAHRIELLTTTGRNHNNIRQYIPMFAEDDFYKEWLSDQFNCDLNQMKNLYGIAYICEKMSIPLYYTTYDEQANYDNTDLARDLAHPGVIWHQKIAKLFLDMVDNELTFAEKSLDIS